jgi:hypothetical protein
MAGSRGGKKRGGSPKVSATLSKQRSKNTGGLLGAVSRARSGIINDVMMGVGLKEKDYKYEARTAATKARRAASNRTDYGNDDSPSRATPRPAPRPPTAAELKAQRKAAELAERKRLGQIARKKFEKEGGKRAAKKRALLLNIA